MRRFQGKVKHSPGSEDLDQLKKQAFHRFDWGADLVRRYLKERNSLSDELRNRADRLYELFLAPITFWPFDLRFLLERLLNAAKSGRSIEPSLLLLIDLLPLQPSPETIRTFVLHEHHVQKGEYEHLVPAAASKFAAYEKLLRKDSAFIADWGKITSRFDVSLYEDAKKIIRRSMVPERNLRNSFNSSWKSKSDRFRAIFDTFCAKWNLYGMQDGRPLLQKLSVNSTPYGTMIFIPNYWSLDPKRDLDWGKISRLHKARGQQRQGPLLAEGLEQRRADLKKLEEAEAKARKFGLRGDKRHEFLCLALGWDVRTDRKRLARLRKSCLGK